MENTDCFYTCPTKMYIVSNGLQKAGEIIKKERYSRIILLLGSHHFQASGNLNTLLASLDNSKIEYLILDGIKPNPEISFVRENIDKIRAFLPDLILAVGGGSVIDTAKSMAKAYYYSKDPLDFNKKIAIPEKSLPLGTILTLAAAGSEMSDSCVMSEYKTGFKGGFNSPLNRPNFSILDPELTLDVSPFQTYCGIVDIISHSFERYFSPSSSYELCDRLALSVIANMVEIAPKLLENPHDLSLRRSMMITSSVAHNGWTSYGKPSFKFVCHFVEHQISGKHPEIAHGLGLRFLLGEFMRINVDTFRDKIITFGFEVFHLTSQNPMDTVEAFNNFLDSLPLEKNMRDVGISEVEEKEYLSQLQM